MNDQDGSKAAQGHANEKEILLPLDGSNQESEQGEQESQETKDTQSNNIKEVLRELKITDWITAIATVVIAGATIWNVVYVGAQLREMRSSSEDTKKLITANETLANAAKLTADAQANIRGRTSPSRAHFSRKLTISRCL